jgi:hypothetical protein
MLMLELEQPKERRDIRCYILSKLEPSTRTLVKRLRRDQDLTHNNMYIVRSCTATSAGATLFSRVDVR